ncbi:hypothetical protein LCGC14_3057220, partial [marine sediment metagenome]
IMVKHSLAIEQLAWRKWAIKNKCQGDEDLFKQEYPATPLEAFRHAGNPVFGAGILHDQEKSLVDVKYGVFVRSKGVTTFEEVDRKINCWQVHSLNNDGQFTIGCDTMEGKSLDTSDKKSKVDNHGMAVFNRNGEFVAAYKGQGDQIDVAEQLLSAALYYNTAFVAPELPNGMVVLQKLKDYGYPNIYNRQTHDETLSVENSDNLGWRTTLVTRKWLVDGMIQILRDGVKVRCPWIYDEMTTFIKDKTGKAVHNTGKHDDVLFAAMIAVQLHLRTPMDEIYPFETTGEEEDQARDYNNLSVIGAIDYGDDEEWDY